MKPLNIHEKITLAMDLHARWGDALKADPAISAQLGQLQDRAKASVEACVGSGVADTCHRCDRDEGGSCCGTGIENRYTPELLLINLLLGASLTQPGRSEKGCLFLGEQGCTLPARDILCINYICLRLQRTIPREKLLHLQEVNGTEMDILFLLHDRVRLFIRQKIG